MAKNRNKKKQKGVVSMDTTEPSASETTQATKDMDTSESGSRTSTFASICRKVKGRPMKRTKNVRKKKALEKAIASHDKSVEKIQKNESKTIRTKSAKVLYD